MFNMAIDIAQYKNAINKFLTGVTVITSKLGEEQIGVTVNSFTSLSFHPALVLFNIGKKGSSIDSLLQAEFFNVNILSSEQEKEAHGFATHGEDKFSGVNYKKDENGIAILENNISTIRCKKKDIIEHGDHYIFICEVFDFSNDERKKPLKYYNSVITR
jgi:flavin reductase (DIM6/NTAB) family NADH-FMN oxidoreductase RutF